MESLITIVNLAMPFFGLILLGVLAAHLIDIEERGLAWLNAFVIYFALPALIFLTVAAAPFERLVDWPFILATTLATYLAFILPFILFVFGFGTPITIAAIQGTSASYGNVGYMGLPLAVAFFGSEAAVPAALIFCFDCTLQFVLTPLLATLGRRERAHPATIALRVAKLVCTHPFIVATILGAIASALKLQAPVMLASLLEMLSRAAGPAALFALGVTLGMRRFAGIGSEFPVIVLTKLFVHPTLVFAMLWLLGSVDPLWVSVAIMMAALPTATNAFVLATQFNAYVEGASSSILVSTALSAVTIPPLIYAIKAGFLP